MSRCLPSCPLKFKRQMMAVVKVQQQPLLQHKICSARDNDRPLSVYRVLCRHLYLLRWRECFWNETQCREKEMFKTRSVLKGKISVYSFLCVKTERDKQSFGVGALSQTHPRGKPGWALGLDVQWKSFSVWRCWCFISPLTKYQACSCAQPEGH